MSNINQYKSIFYLLWVVPFIIFPAWALPISVTARASVFIGLLIYFSISAVIMNRWFNSIEVGKPLFSRTKHLSILIKDNLLLVVVCCLAVVLHIRFLSLPMLIMGDEALHLTNGLLIYEYIDHTWHKTFQILFWVFAGLLVIASYLNAASGTILKNIREKIYALISNSSFKYFLVFLCVVFAFGYFFFLKDMAYTLTLIRYPPIGKLLYFIIYSAFGINHIFPRIAQLIFYLLCAVYIYRTILLFHDKQTALLGATIYLFLPISFAYAYLGEIESGVILFIAAISYYFLRFIKERDNRDLLLASFLLWSGYLYKDPALLVFPVCFIFLLYYIIKKPSLFQAMHLKILLLAIVPVFPWMIITKLFSWRNYTFVLANISYDRIADYFSVIAMNVSEVVFVIFVFSFIYYCFFKRSMLTSFFALLFMVYCFFIITDMAAISPRFSMAVYPTITIFISSFIVFMLKKIPWEHSVKVFSGLLITYLIVISSMLPSDNRFLTIENRKLHYFLSEQAMKWIKENINEGEKILTMRIMSTDFYSIKYGIDRRRIVGFWYEIDEVSTPEKIKDFSRKNKITHIMFPYNAHIGGIPGFEIFSYLKSNPLNEFSELAKFNSGDNLIYIYKVNEN